ncbi:MAG: hypothetical protein ACRDTC_25935 [Pseudonocardiaceae bacterium]
MSTDSTPAIHPYKSLIAPDDEQVDIDTELVPLVRVLWARGLVIVACCQDHRRVRSRTP